MTDRMLISTSSVLHNRLKSLSLPYHKMNAIWPCFINVECVSQRLLLMGDVSMTLFSKKSVFYVIWDRKLGTGWAENLEFDILFAMKIKSYTPPASSLSYVNVSLVNSINNANLLQYSTTVVVTRNVWKIFQKIRVSILQGGCKHRPGSRRKGHWVLLIGLGG